MGPGRSRGRSKGHPGRTAGKQVAGRRNGEESPRTPIRFLGDELDGVQLRGRRRAAWINRQPNRVPHVPAGGNRGWPPRLPRPRQLQIRNLLKGTYIRNCLSTTPYSGLADTRDKFRICGIVDTLTGSSYTLSQWWQNTSTGVLHGRGHQGWAR